MVPDVGRFDHLPDEVAVDEQEGHYDQDEHNCQGVHLILCLWSEKQPQSTLSWSRVCPSRVLINALGCTRTHGYYDEQILRGEFLDQGVL